MLFAKSGAKICPVCIILIICSLLCINASAFDEQHWYCKRNSDHKQPSLDASMQWINDHNCIYVDKKHGDDCKDKVIYLTFDAGYENGNVDRILDVLNKENVKGAFFILENLIDRNPELVKKMTDHGHLVCNHTAKHKNIAKLSDQAILSEIKDLEQSYYNLTGKQMSKYFRPPEGTFDIRSINTLDENGYTTVLWSFAYADWDNAKQMSSDKAIEKIMDNLHNGEIMLLHPTSATNAQILSEVIEKIKAEGYRFGTLDEICDNS